METIPSAKGRFHFRTGCPSYIYPADILSNVRKLASCVDAVEIVLFESSRPENLPSGETCKELASIGAGENLSYIIHLPLDCRLGHSEREIRKYGAETFMTYIDATSAVNPESYIIHFDPSGRGDGIDTWKNRLQEGMAEVCDTTGLTSDIAVEMLEYPFEDTAEIVESLGLSVCFEAGHLLLAEKNLVQYYESFKNRISVMHVHGVFQEKAHFPPDVMKPADIEDLQNILERFTGIVIFEVFSCEYLRRTIEYMKRKLNVRA